MNLHAWVVPGSALVAVAAFGLNAVLTPAVTRLAHRHRWYDVPNWRKLHTGLIPRIGGLAIFLSLALAATAGLLLLAVLGAPLAGPVMPLLAAAGGVVLIFAVGLYDDFAPLRARTKFLLQIVAAFIIAVGGVQIGTISLPLLGRLELGIAAVPLTVLWIVGMTNAVNMIDGMDGLSGGIAAFAAAGMAIVALLQGYVLTAILAVALFGALLGFLLSNWPPAAIIMGDSGSHLLGFVLAILPLLEVGSAATLHTLLVPVTLVLIPILDCAAAVVRRIRQRRSLGAADKSHIHHRLLALGLGHRQILVAVYAACGYLTVVAIASVVALRGAAVYLTVVAWAVVLLAYRLLMLIAVRQRRGERP